MMARANSEGTTLVEVLVGLVIGLVVAVGILDAFAATEGRRRTTTGLAEAESAGTLAMFLLGADLANAGNGLSAAAADLAACPNTGDIRSTLRPIPVLIVAGASKDVSDALVVNHTAAPALAGAVPLATAVAAGDPLRVTAPLGFGSGDSIVVIGPDGHCAATTVAAPPVPHADGQIELARTDASDAFPSGTRVFNRGPASGVARVRYDVASGALRSQDLMTPDASPNPLVSGVVLFKAQYGVDTDGDGYLDSWVAADATSWSANEVLAMSSAMLARIRAVRFGLIVRSDAWAPELAASQEWVLFDCTAADKLRCPGRLSGALSARWRYRVYETVVPLRNAIHHIGT